MTSHGGVRVLSYFEIFLVGTSKSDSKTCMRNTFISANHYFINPFCYYTLKTGKSISIFWSMYWRILVHFFMQCTIGYPIETQFIVTKCNRANIAITQSCWLDHRKPLLQGFWYTCNPLCSISFGLEAPSMKLCYEISLLSLLFSRKEKLEPILCRALSMVQPTSMGQKIQSSFICSQGECEWARDEKMALSLAFTLVSNKAMDWLVLVSCWAICEASAQNWSQG